MGKANEKNYKDILIVVKNPLIKNLLELVKNDEITIYMTQSLCNEITKLLEYEKK